MRRTLQSLLIVASGFLLASQACGAPLRYGDVLVNELFEPAIRQYRADGTLADSYGGSAIWEGAGVTPDGRLVTTFRGPSTGLSQYRQGGLTFFSPDGTQQSVITPQVNLAGDVSVFRDGTLAVSSQFGSSIEMYDLAGVHLRSITHPAFAGDKSPNGTTIGPDDTLWTASARSPTINHFSKSGAFLGSFNASFDVGEVAVDPVDGTLWLPDENGNRVYNYSPTGLLLSSFITGVPIDNQTFHGIAIGPQRSIYVGSRNSGRVYRYDRGGQLLGSFPVASDYLVYLNVIVPEPVSCLQALSCLVLITLPRQRRFAMRSPSKC